MDWSITYYSMKNLVMMIVKFYKVILKVILFLFQKFREGRILLWEKLSIQLL